VPPRRLYADVQRFDRRSLWVALGCVRNVFCVSQCGSDAWFAPKKRSTGSDVLVGRAAVPVGRFLAGRLAGTALPFIQLDDGATRTGRATLSR